MLNVQRVVKHTLMQESLFMMQGGLSKVLNIHELLHILLCKRLFVESKVGKVWHVQQLLNTLLSRRLFMQSGVGKVFNIQL